MTAQKHYCKTLTEQELRLQRKEEKYAIHISMLSEEEESDTETDTALMKPLTHILTKKNEHILERSERTLKNDKFYIFWNVKICSSYFSRSYCVKF